MTFNHLKYSVLTILFSTTTLFVTAQVTKPVRPSEPDSVYVVDSIETLPDSLELYEEQRQADFQEARDVLGESEVMKMFEALEGIPYFGEDHLEFDPGAMNVYGYDYGEIPVFDDSVYVQRIEQLAGQTTIPLVYNAHVKPFIELYAVRRRSLMGRMLGLSYVYFPLFEEMLDKYNMPLELKYLAVVESALNPVAGSWAGAKGLWQFMYGTGKQYGLQSNTLVEERFDPLKETEAACQFMLDLYNRYKDWFLVLAAYNSGPGTVNKAIVRAGGVMDYWAIWPYLPRETQGYVPAFIAVNYVMNYASAHNLYPIDPGLLMSGTDTVTVRDAVSFDQLTETLGVSMRDVKFFNPQYTKEIIPANDSTPYLLRLPTQYALQFVEKEQEIYAYKTKASLEKEKIVAEVSKVSDRTVHTVKKGETLSSIAGKYHVTVSNLKKWNSLRSNTLRVGQRLTIYSSGGPMASGGNSSAVGSSAPKYYTVKAGDTLASIAKKYHTTVSNLKKWNKLKSDKIRVKQRLRVSK
ncbi:MAG: LysM peptidoglycan-binding domain-containing protein [Bacteroidales bacterium]|nr:LysM peptidoglycan-binding domain-containing protein [Bacteroidales bacterium]